MTDFDPEYVYIIGLQYMQKQVYYEEITSVPSRVRGAYLTDEERKDKVTFIIKDPQGKELVKNTLDQSIFEFEAETPGRYEIHFKNKSPGNVRLTFTMCTGQHNIVSSKDLDPARGLLDDIYKQTKELKLSYKLTQSMHTDRYKSKLY